MEKRHGYVSVSTALVFHVLGILMISGLLADPI